MGRPRKPGGPTDQGYGIDHQRLRAMLLAAWWPGMPCSRCGQPMLKRWTTNRNGKIVTAIHLDHSDDRTRWLGLSHRECNVAHCLPEPGTTSPGRRW